MKALLSSLLTFAAPAIKLHPVLHIGEYGHCCWKTRKQTGWTETVPVSCPLPFWVSRPWQSSLGFGGCSWLQNRTTWATDVQGSVGILLAEQGRSYRAEYLLYPFFLSFWDDSEGEFTSIIMWRLYTQPTTVSSFQSLNRPSLILPQDPCPNWAPTWDSHASQVHPLELHTQISPPQRTLH